MISIIVPVYNAEKYIRQCLDSIRKQSYTDFEVILVDDGSTDGSGIICDEYAKADNRFHVIHQENGGVSVARNTGIDNAKGENLVFVDSDDYLDLSYLYNIASNSHYDLVISGYETFPNNNKIVLTDAFYSLSEISSFIQNNLSRLYFTVPWCKLYKTKLIKEGKIRFAINIRLAEDWLFNLNYLLQCKSIQTISYNGYFYFEGEKLAEEKYQLSKKEIEIILQNIVLVYNQLRSKFNLLDSTSLNLKGICACFPLIEILNNSDSEYYELCKKYANIRDRREFYSDIICSPIHRSVYAIKNCYLYKQYHKGKSLMSQLSEVYHEEVLPDHYSNFLQRILCYSIMKKYFIVSDMFLRLYSWIKRF